MSAAGDRYRFSYGPGTPYSHAVGLVERWAPPDGEVVVDLGCGFGAIAEPVRDLGLAYLGVDLDDSGLGSLDVRGFEVLASDVAAPGELLDALTTALAGRRLAAITALDCFEHLPNATEVLRALSRYAMHSGKAPLVVSIPNVSHRDVAAKLLIGRWDVTTTGLLDETHMRFFAPSTLTTAMTATGWTELEADDFEREESDQHFPSDCPVLLPTTPIGVLFRRVRASAAPGGITNQFVRAYRPAAAGDGTEEASGGAGWPAAPDGGRRPFLSVLVPSADADLAALDPLLDSLAMQASGDFEVVIVASPPPLAVATGGQARPPEDLEGALTERHQALAGHLRVIIGPDAVAPAGVDVDAAMRAVRAARGRYVAFLGAGDVAEPGWVTELVQTAAPTPGRVLDAGRARDATIPGLPGLLADHPGALSAFAFPRSVFMDMGVQLRDGGASSQWRLLVDAVQVCGLSPTPSRDLVRRRNHAGAPAGDTAWRATGTEVLAALDVGPLLLDRGSATWLVQLRDERDGLARACEQLQLQLSAVHGSTSWRVTAPLRTLMAWWRHR